jgi:hypothetical protein
VSNPPNVVRMAAASPLVTGAGSALPAGDPWPDDDPYDSREHVDGEVDGPSRMLANEVANQLRRMRATEEAKRILANERRTRRGPMQSRALSSGGLDHIPEPEYLIQDVIAEDTTAVLVGKRGSGKSFVAIDWSLCLATGKEWQGKAVKPKRVLYVAAEGASGIRKRVRAWESAFNGGKRVAEDWFTIYPEPVQLFSSEDVDELIEWAKAAEFGLVVFDTWARCTVGVEENSAKEAGIVVDNVDRVRKATSSGSALIVHHTGRNGELRGSSSIDGAADTIVKVRQDLERHDRIELYLDKQKNDPDGFSLGNYRLTEHDRSCIVTSSVVTESVVRTEDMALRQSQMVQVYLEQEYDAVSGTTKAEWAVAAKERFGISKSTAFKTINTFIGKEQAEQVGNKVRWIMQD